MAQIREAAGLAEFVKFQHLGAAVMGRVTRIGKNNNGQFLVMSPAMYRSSMNESFTRYEEVAVGLSTDPASKVHSDDVNRMLLFVFVDTKATSKDPLKIFNVAEVTGDEMRAILSGVSDEKIEGLLGRPAVPVAADEDQDDLPF